MDNMDNNQITKHFTFNELKCKCGCNRMEIDDAFLAKLEDLRIAMDRPMIITSGYRCPAHNAAVSATGAIGPHTVGAVDIAISGEAAHTLLQLAFMIGFTGIGLKLHGPITSRFIHLDDLPPNTRLRPRVWSY